MPANNGGGRFETLSSLVLLLVFLIGGSLLFVRPWESWDLPTQEEKKAAKAENTQVATNVTNTLNTLSRTSKTAVKEFLPGPTKAPNTLVNSKLSISERFTAGRLGQQAAEMQLLAEANQLSQSKLTDSVKPIVATNSTKISALSKQLAKPLAEISPTPNITLTPRVKPKPTPAPQASAKPLNKITPVPTTVSPSPVANKANDNKPSPTPSLALSSHPNIITPAKFTEIKPTPKLIPVLPSTKATESHAKPLTPTPTTINTPHYRASLTTRPTAIQRSSSSTLQQTSAITPLPTIMLPVMPTVPVNVTFVPIDLPQDLQIVAVTITESPELTPTILHTPAPTSQTISHVPVPTLTPLPIPSTLAKTLPKAKIIPTVKVTNNTVHLPVMPTVPTLSAELPTRNTTFFLRESIDFTLASAELPAEAEARLLDIALLVKLEPRKLRVIGHTDNLGDPEFNRRLSLQRAQTVKAFLIKAGVKADQLTVEGVGDSQPIADNMTEEGQRANRRIEITD